MIKKKTQEVSCASCTVGCINDMIAWHQSVCSPSPIYSNAGKTERQLKVSGVVQVR